MDIGVGPFSITHVRYVAVDFTVPYYEEPTVILIPAPTEMPKFFACSRPFQLSVWLNLLAVVFLLPFIIWMYQRLCRKIPINARYSEISLNDIYISVFRILLSQSRPDIST